MTTETQEAMTTGPKYETILVETARPGVGLITLNRPKSLNALNSTIEREVLAAALAFEKSAEIGAIVITGSDRAFAAGADIAEMSKLTYADVQTTPLFDGWDRLAQLRTPIIAAVSGYALGGGCELAMLCDFIIASDTAKFAQPEINLGIHPGIGGSQRLVRAVGKAKAMDMCLTGRMMDAAEAERAGLVSRVVGVESLLDEALTAAATIARQSRHAAATTKECVNRAFESSLTEGMRFERAQFHARFATADQKEGMSAFMEKREPKFVNA